MHQVRGYKVLTASSRIPLNSIFLILFQFEKPPDKQLIRPLEHRAFVSFKKNKNENALMETKIVQIPNNTYTNASPNTNTNYKYQITATLYQIT